MSQTQRYLVRTQSPLDQDPYLQYIAAAIEQGQTNASIVKNVRGVWNLDTTDDSIRRFRKRHGLQVPGVEGEPCGMTISEDEVVITEPPTQRPKLGDVGKLIRERGLDPDEWIVVSTTLNEWDSMTAVKRGDPPKTVRLKQWKVVLRRGPQFLLASPAIHVPTIKRSRILPVSGLPEIIVIEGDHQAPYFDSALHEMSLYALDDLSRHHNLTEHVFLGDTGDFPTISRHADHPAATATVNEVIQATYGVLRDKAEAAPNARRRKLKGNHDWRVESELLLRAERMYGIRPADVGEGQQLPALALQRLLHLDALGIELVEDPRGWEHGEIELVPGVGGLVVRHGWLTGANTAKRSLEKRGRSLIVGHTHQREHIYQWDPSAGLERQAVVTGTMSLTRDQRFPHYAVADNWLQGFVIVTRWPDNHFEIEHARWDGVTLSWRGRRYG